MPRPIAYKTGSIQPPNTAKQSNILIGVAPADWGVSVANTTFYNGVDSSYQYVIIKNSNPPLMWGTGDFTNTSLLTIINGLPDRVGLTPFTGATTAINWLLESGNYSLLKNEQPYGGPITNGLVLDFCPKVNNYMANGDFAYGTTIGWVGYGGSPFIYDITNDRPYVGSKSTKALANIGGGFTWGRYTNPVYGPGGLLVTGQTYTFSFWGKVISGPNFNINWNNQNGSGDQSSWTDGNYPVTTTWQKYTQTFTYNISKNFLYIAGSYAGNTQYVLTEFQLENGTTANAFSAFPVTAAGLTIPNNGLLNTSSFSLINGPYLNAINNGNINLDGVDDYVLLTDSTLKTYTTITANIWMYLNSYTSTFETYFSYNAEEAGLTQGWGIRRSGEAVFQYWGGTGNSGIKLYKNGSLVGSSNSTWAVVSGINTTGSWVMITLVATGVSSWNTHNRLTMGTRSEFLNTATNMNIGSFNLYNRELSAGEIENLYTSSLPIYLPSSSIMINSGLVLYLDASNTNSYSGTGTAWNDLSGYGNNFTLVNSPTFNTGNGGYFQFDGVDDYAYLAVNSSISVGTSCSLEMVVKNDYAMRMGQAGGYWSYGFEGAGFSHTCGGNGNINPYFVGNGFHHYVFTWNQARNNHSMYRDGVLVYSFTPTCGFTAGGGGFFVLGGTYGPSSFQSYGSPHIAMLRLYNKILTNVEVQQNFNSIKTQYGL
jgi:hypothetical protein